MSYGAIGQNKVNQRESLNLWYILRHIGLELILGPKGQKSFGSKVTERLTTPMLLGIVMAFINIRQMTRPYADYPAFRFTFYIYDAAVR